MSFLMSITSVEEFLSDSGLRLNIEAQMREGTWAPGVQQTRSADLTKSSYIKQPFGEVIPGIQINGFYFPSKVNMHKEITFRLSLRFF